MISNNHNKFLVLFNARWVMDQFFIEHVNLENVKVLSMYKLYKKDFKYSLAAFWMQKAKLPFQSFWYDDWKYDLLAYDVVIVNAQNLSWNILSFIKNKNPHIRIIVWYWDTLNERNRLPDKYKSFCEVWSFDHNDCLRFGFKKNLQFYWPLPLPDLPIRYDAMFVGQDKGRAAQLKEISDALADCGLTSFLFVQPSSKHGLTKHMGLTKHEGHGKHNKREGHGKHEGQGKYMGPNKHEGQGKHNGHGKYKGQGKHNAPKSLSYEQVLSLIAQSTCIIDIPKDGQSGMTMRVLEALFYQKKLITTDKHIAGENFFHPHNIFIWRHPLPNPLELLRFFSLPLVSLSQDALSQHSFEAWIRRFQ